MSPDFETDSQLQICVSGYGFTCDPGKVPRCCICVNSATCSKIKELYHCRIRWVIFPGDRLIARDNWPSSLQSTRTASLSIRRVEIISISIWVPKDFILRTCGSIPLLNEVSFPEYTTSSVRHRKLWIVDSQGKASILHCHPPAFLKQWLQSKAKACNFGTTRLSRY
jgi:hypothetical protein